VDDALVDGTQTVTITASAAGYVDGSETVDVTDYEGLTVTIGANAISENGGATTATVTRTDAAGALTVTLGSSDTGEATVVASIVIPDGQTTSAPFAITAVDDALVDGTQTVTITASAAGYVDGSDTLDVTETFDGGYVGSFVGFVTVYIDDGWVSYDVPGLGVSDNSFEAAILDGHVSVSVPGISGTGTGVISEAGEFSVTASGYVLGCPASVEYIGTLVASEHGVTGSGTWQITAAEAPLVGGSGTWTVSRSHTSVFDGPYSGSYSGTVIHVLKDGWETYPIPGLLVPDNSIVANVSSGVVDVSVPGIGGSGKTVIFPSGGDIVIAVRGAIYGYGVTVTYSGRVDVVTSPSGEVVEGSGTWTLVTGDPDWSGSGTWEVAKEPTDFGDAPDSAQTGFADSYPVTYAEGGACHLATGPILGTARDNELAGTHSAAADADDTTGTSDDEDGVTFTTDLNPGQDTTAAVAASGAGELSFWVDFDQSGSFDNATERFTHSFTAAGTEDITFAVPASANLGQTYARFRFSTTLVPDPTGLASDGEVEDYRISIVNPIGAELTVTIGADAISENGGTTTATVTRTDATGALTVTLGSSDTGEATVVASIVIPDGQTTSAPFAITAVDDALVDGTQTVTITASAAGYADGSDTVQVTDDDVPDGDADGVSSTVEAGAPNGGDGNLDGIPDDEQANVASLVCLDGSHYVTLATPDSADLEGVHADANPSPNDVPPAVQFPLQFIHFSIANGQATAVTVTVFVEAGTTVNTYYKYGPTPENQTPHWYPFLFDGTTGAVVFADRIELHFVDGLRGDDDLLQDGRIVDIGAPGISTHPWQNPTVPFDVDNNGLVAAVDVLTLINEINIGGNRDLPAVPQGAGQLPPYLDVSGDDRLEPVDVLNVIDYINNRSSGGGEGEGLLDRPASVGLFSENVAVSAAAPVFGFEALPVRPDAQARATATDAVLNLLGDDETVEVRRPPEASGTALSDLLSRATLRRRRIHVDQADLVDAALAEWDPILPGLGLGS
jgi:hypothetical protein